MQFSVGSDENSLDIFKAVDKLHAFFETEGKAGGAQTVSVNGLVGNNSDREETVIIGISRFGI